MHGFLSLAPIVALLLGQAEPAGSPSEQAPPVPAAPEASPAAVEAPAPKAEARPGALGREAAQGEPEPSRTPAAPARATEAERVSVARAALALLDAVLAGDAAAAAAASAERFSFDGDVRVGREEVRRTWHAQLAERDPAQRGTLLDLELLPVADAVARLGPPPPKLAPLVAVRGAWVAIANVSRRPVVLFLAREGGRWAVVGIE
jgi:hypothetical protein